MRCCRLCSRGSNPEKYGTQAGNKDKGRKKWRERERKRLRAEVREEFEREQEEGCEGECEEVQRAILARIDRMLQHDIETRGYTHRAENGLHVPPGWTVVPIGHAEDGHIGRPACPVSDPEGDGVPFPVPTR